MTMALGLVPRVTSTDLRTNAEGRNHFVMRFKLTYYWRFPG